MIKISAALLMMVGVFSVQPALSAEFWNCNYVYVSQDKSPGAPPPLNIPARYEIDKTEVRLLNGVAEREQDQYFPLTHRKLD
jgi:hypothetical protein